MKECSFGRAEGFELAIPYAERRQSYDGNSARKCAVDESVRARDKVREVVISSPAHRLRGQAPQALATGSPLLSLQREAEVDDRFAHEMRSISAVTVATTTSAT